MTRHRAPSKSTRLILAELQDQPLHGYSLMKSTGLKSGTLYPILMRLTDRGFLEAKWETADTPGKPPRQIYSLTAQGKRYTQDALNPASPLLKTQGVTS